MTPHASSCVNSWARLPKFDKSQIVAKLRSAQLRKRAKEGRFEGRKPYGFYEGDKAQSGG